MDFLEHELEEILNIFREESEEQIQKLNKNLLKLESNPKDYTVISELFREAHSLKGAARMIGLEDIQSIAHKLEDVLGMAKEGTLQVTSDVIDTLCKTVDAISSIVNESIETRGKAETQEIQPVIDALEGIINSDQEPPAAENPMPTMFTQNDENLKKLLMQARAHIEKLKVFPSNADVIEEFLFFVNELAKAIEPSNNGRLKELVQDIKIKIETTLKGSGILLGSEVDEIEEMLDTLDIVDKNQPIEETFVQEDGPKEPEEKQEQTQEQQEDVDEITFIKNNFQKFDDIIPKLSSLMAKINDASIKEIIEKIAELMIFSKAKDFPLSQEIVDILMESFNGVVDLLEPSSETQGDPELILQRVTVLQQMLKLSVQQEEEEAAAPQANLTPAQNTEVLPKKGSQEDDATPQIDLKFGESNTIKTLRVDTQKLDHLVNQVGELIIAKIKAQEHLTDLEKIIRTVEEWYREWSKTKQYFRHIDKYHKSPEKVLPIATYSLSKSINTFFEENSTKLSNLMTKMNSLYKVIQEDDARMNLIVNGLEEKIKSVRVLPLATIFHLFPRMVRDIARERNKEIDFVITGSETSVDKKIIEEIKSPLMHILRNSIDHGIETPEERAKNGKPPIGKILLGAYHLENSILIEITDDGKGIDTSSIKQKVLQKGLLTPEELEAMSEEQIMNIIFWPGFSTGEIVTDISGRGIGLDIVHTKISQLNGKIKVKSTLGQGCQVSIQLPVTMATIKSFLVEVNDQTFAIPTSAIKTTQLIDKDKIIYKEGRKTIIVDDRTVPICSLAQTMEMPESDSGSDKLVTIIVQAEDTQIGFIVDRLVGDQEILHKNLSAPLLRVRNIAGITTLGSGDLCLILNVNDLVKSAYMNFGKTCIKPILAMKKDKECKGKNILVADDSTTTRILQKNILKAAGYNVEIAVNGFDALTKAMSQDFDIIVSDVEMPEINGFELAERIRNNEKLNDIPIILVTSLASEQDKKRGLSAGANAYITKGDFDQEELLSTIQRLIG